jgi:hypothetical protein
MGKPLKRLIRYVACNTWLKPGVNEMGDQIIQKRCLYECEIVGALRSLPHCDRRCHSSSA